MKNRQAISASVSLVLLSSVIVHAKHRNEQTKAAPAVVTSLSAEDKCHLLQDTFSLLGTVREIPEPVQRLLLPDRKQPLNGMADPGREYQESDLIGPSPLPFRRLVFAATSPGYCLVYNEQGGIGYWQRVSLYRLNGGRASLVWETSLLPERHLLNFAELRARICNGKYDELKRGS